jgi:ubiquinone/menaquinone biosynthesis C-methylase UbiE
MMHHPCFDKKSNKVQRMEPSRVNYDLIAKKYNQRYQEDRLEKIENALVQLAYQSNAKTILEVGCGTGRWLQGLDNQLDEAQLFGLDFSQGMLAQAQEQPTRLSLMQAQASQPPIKANTYDLIFCVNALHHFHDPQKFVFRARQLLRPKGKLAIIGQVPQDRRIHWYVYDYFEGTYETDLVRFPSWGNVTDWLVSAGFEAIEWHPLHQIIDDKQGWAVLDDPFLQKHAVSQLAMLSETKYKSGIAKIKRALKNAEAQNKTLTFPTRLRLDMLVGTV